MDKRVLVCGDRKWDDYQAVTAAIHAMVAQLPEGDSLTVVHGAASGADEMADAAAKRLGCDVLAFVAEWELFGRAAGPIRNKRMLVEGKPCTVVYFHRDLRNSKGTANMVRQAHKAGVPVLNGMALAIGIGIMDWRLP